MSKFGTSVVTEQGKALLFGDEKIIYTKAALFSQDLSKSSVEDIRKLTSLSGKLFETPIGINKRGAGTVNVEASFSNKDLTEDIDFNSVGWFAKPDGGEEILVSVSPVNGTQTLGAMTPGQQATDAIDLVLATAVGDSSKVDVVIDPAGQVTAAKLNSIVENLKVEFNQNIEENTKVQDFPTDITDLNNLPGGLYRLSNLTATQLRQLDNSPVKLPTASFAKFVFIRSIEVSPYFAIQITLFNDNPHIFVRCKKNANWYKWVKFATADSLDSLHKLLDENVDNLIKKYKYLADTKADQTDVDSKISTLSSTVASNKTDTDKKIADVSSTVSANKTAADKAISSVQSTVEANKAAADKAIASANSTIAANKKAADDALATKANASDVSKQIAAVNATVSSNKSATDKAISDTNATVTANKKDADTKISNLNSTVASNKTATDKAISDTNATVAANKKATDSAIATKANANDVYNRQQVDGAFATRDSSISTKADKSTTYTKTEVDAKMASLQNNVNAKANSSDLNNLNGKAHYDKPDFNSLTTTGNYYISTPSSGKNYPCGSWGNLQVFYGNGSRLEQVYYPDDNSAPYYRMRKDASSWTAWKQLVNTDTTNSLSQNKADKSTTYTKTDVDNKLNGRVPVYVGNANEDMNSYTNIQFRSYTQKSGLKNIPSDTIYPAYGTLIVLPDGGISNFNDGAQVWIDPNGMVWTRHYNSKKFSNWSKLAFSSQINDLKNSLTSAISQKANTSDVNSTNSALQTAINSKIDKIKVLPSSVTDLNNFKQEGWWSVSDISGTQFVSIKNTPVNDQYALLHVVPRAANANNGIQIWYATNSGDVYERQWSATSVWHGWNKLATTAYTDGIKSSLQSSINAKANKSDLNNLNGVTTYKDPNFNNITASGTYYISNPTTANNAPTTSWGNLLVANGNGNRLEQIYFADNDAAPYYRMRVGTTWRGWKKLVNTDTTDGINSTANAAKTAAANAQTTANNALPKAGGVMNSGSNIQWNSSIANGSKGTVGKITWSGATDYVEIFGDQNAKDNLDLAINLGDDGSNHISIRNKGSEVAAIQSNGHFTGTVDWSKVNGRPSNFNTYALTERRSLSGNDDANTITDTGIYRISGTAIKNGNGVTWAFLVVLKWDNNTVQQYLVQGDSVYQRNISASGKRYPGWTYFAKKSHIDNLQNQINQIKSTVPVVQKFTDESQAKTWSNSGGSQVRIAIIE